MTRTRRLLSLLLLGALLLPQGVRAGASECEGVGATAGPALPSGPAHPVPVSDTGCRRHHPDTAPLPAGTQHCAVSFDCASMAALPMASPDRREAPAVLTVRAALVPLPASSSPEPQAPPPRV